MTPGPAHTSAGPAYRVLKIAPTPFFSDYGCHVRVLEETLALQKLGDQVTICTYHTGRDLTGLTIERIVDIPWRRASQAGPSKAKFGFDLLLSIKSAQVFLRQKPDIVHGHLHEGAFIGFPLSRLGSVPLVLDFQGSMTAEMVDHRFLKPDGPFYQPARRLEWLINRMPQAIITSSGHGADLLVQEFGCDSRRIYTVPDAVNANFFTPAWKTDPIGPDGRPAGPTTLAQLRQSLGIPADRRIVVSLGLLAAYQGTDLLIHAAKQVIARRPDVHFLIMGYPHEPEYRQLAADLGISDHVTLPGKIPYEDAPLYLALGEVAVSAKISATEGAGKLLNYMAMALPTVAFDTPVSQEYLGRYGCYAPVKDVAGLAAAIGQLLDDPAGAAQRGDGLRARAQAYFTWEKASQLIHHVYAIVSQ